MGEEFDEGDDEARRAVADLDEGVGFVGVWGGMWVPMPLRGLEGEKRAKVGL